MEIVLALIEIARRLARAAGPYLLVEILLPGGSLIALALFLYRHRAPVSISLIAKRLYTKAPESHPVLSRR